jgi:hypothetical protein
MRLIILLLTATAASAAEPLPETFCDQTPRIMAQVQALGLASQGKTPPINGYAYEMFKSDTELVTLQHASNGRSCIFTSAPVAPKRYQTRRVTTSNRDETLCQPADDVRHRILSGGFKSVAKAACQGQSFEFFDDGVAILTSKSGNDGLTCMKAWEFDLID